MRSLSSSDLLQIWERGAAKTSIKQALIILETVFPQVPGDLLAKLNVGQRDLCLLHLRTLTFGSRLNGLAECPACHQRLELDFSAYDLLGSSPHLPDLETLASYDDEMVFLMNNYQVSFRLPNSADLADLENKKDLQSGRQRLLEVCILSARCGDTPVSSRELPNEVLNGIVERMGNSEPLVDLTLSASCPTCEHRWEIIFDVVSFFWGEIQAWAARLMREVHALAMAYGWRESDILAMSAWRRRKYLQLIGI